MTRHNRRGPDSSLISPWIFVCTWRSLMDHQRPYPCEYNVGTCDPKLIQTLFQPPNLEYRPLSWDSRGLYGMGFSIGLNSAPEYFRP